MRAEGVYVAKFGSRKGNGKLFSKYKRNNFSNRAEKLKKQLRHQDKIETCIKLFGNPHEHLLLFVLVCF